MGCSPPGPPVDAGAYDRAEPTTTEAPAPQGTPAPVRPPPQRAITTLQGPPIAPADLPPGAGWFCFQTQVDLHCERTEAACTNFYEAAIRVATRDGSPRTEAEKYFGKCGPRRTAWCRFQAQDDGSKFLTCAEQQEMCTINLPPEGMAPPPGFFKPGDTGCAELP